MNKPHPILGPPPGSMEEVQQRLAKLETILTATAPPGLDSAVKFVERAINTYGVPIPPESVSILLEAARELRRITTPTSEVPTPTGGVEG